MDGACTCMRLAASCMQVLRIAYSCCRLHASACRLHTVAADVADCPPSPSPSPSPSPPPSHSPSLSPSHAQMSPQATVETTTVMANISPQPPRGSCARVWMLRERKQKRRGAWRATPHRTGRSSPQEHTQPDIGMGIQPPDDPPVWNRPRVAVAQLEPTALHCSAMACWIGMIGRKRGGRDGKASASNGGTHGGAGGSHQRDAGRRALWPWRGDARRARAVRTRGHAASVGLRRQLQRRAASTRDGADQLRAVAQPRRTLRWSPTL